MTKAGDSLIAGLNDALAYVRGDKTRGHAHTIRVPDHVDVKALRQRLGLTQIAFARRYGFSLTAVRNWEQGRRHPTGAVRMLLTIIEKEPEAVERALATG
jgi:putative transcriptional regulator